MKKARESPELRRWATLVLPWLPPPDLATASAACKALREIAKSITLRRASDAGRGLETHPIPFINPVGTEPYSYFIYSRFPLMGLSSSPPSSQPWGGDTEIPISDFSSSVALASPPIAGRDVGCGCEDCSLEDSGDFAGCPCSSQKVEFLSGLDAGTELMRECGASCRCGSECGNRLTQRGVAVRLRIVKDRRKGWGLHAAELLARGQFVCEYAGEFLTTEEARRRQRVYDELASTGVLSPALLVVREHLPSGKACLRVNIDATRVGNVARFINHSCDGGNLSAVLVRNSGSLLPRLCFFAAVDILEGEELTFSYGDTRLRQNGLPCFCGSSSCSGTLPSEDT